MSLYFQLSSPMSIDSTLNYSRGHLYAPSFSTNSWFLPSKPSIAISYITSVLFHTTTLLAFLLLQLHVLLMFKFLLISQVVPLLLVTARNSLWSSRSGLLYISPSNPSLPWKPLEILPRPTLLPLSLGSHMWNNHIFLQSLPPTPTGILGQSKNRVWVPQPRALSPSIVNDHVCWEHYINRSWQ